MPASLRNSANSSKEISLGVWGRTDRLPEKGVLEISTMCGHGVMTFSLIKKWADDVKQGTTSAKAAAENLAEQCSCGIVNLPRVERLITALAAK